MSQLPGKPRIVVIGGGVASAAAVAGLRAEGFDGRITLVSAENTVPYERPPLSKEFLRDEAGGGTAVISLNRPKDVLDVRRLIARDHHATAGQLQDESIPLKGLASSRQATATATADQGSITR